MTSESVVRHTIRLADGDVAYRTAAWGEVARSSGEAVMTPEQAERFESESRWRRLGPVMVAHVSASDFRLVRTPEWVARVEADLVFFNFMLEGRVQGACGRRAMDFTAGDLSVTKLSSTVDFDIQGFAWTVIVVSREALEAVTGRMDALDGRVFRAGSPEASLVGAHIDALLGLPDPIDSAQASLAGKTCLAMLGACFGQKTGALERPVEADADIAKRVRRFVDARLADPELGQEMICRELGLSRSRLYRVLGERSDLASAIRQLRLVRAHREIASPKSGEAPLTDIAARYGFKEVRSFRRAFGQAFGYSPADLRDISRQGRAPLPEAGVVIADWMKDL